MNTGKTIEFMHKQASESATDKAMAYASKIGKPTSTGILAGAGTGAVLATLAAMRNSNSGKGDDGVLSNPLALGLLGAGAGYLGGNAFENVPEYQSESKSKPGYLLSSLLALGGLSHIGSRLAELDLESNKITKLKDLNRFKARHSRRLSEEQVNDYLNKKNDVIKAFQETGASDRDIALVLGEEFDSKPKGKAGKGKTIKETASYGNKLLKGKWNPINQLKALNPFKDVSNALAYKATGGSASTITHSNGRKLLGEQLGHMLGISGPKEHRSLLNTKVLPARLAALATLGGLGITGVNFVRNKISKD